MIIYRAEIYFGTMRINDIEPNKYDVELVETKSNTLILKEKLDGLEEKRKSKDNFLKAVRSFMEMKALNPVILRELVEKIEVYQIEGQARTAHRELSSIIASLVVCRSPNGTESVRSHLRADKALR